MAGSFDGADHDVRLAGGSLAARAAGEVDHSTKSHHHQGVGALGDGFVATGWSTLDELPERLRSTEAPLEAARRARIIASYGRTVDG